MSAGADRRRSDEAIGPLQLSGADRVIVSLVRAAVADVVAIYRFGSTVEGTTHRESDVDIALLARQPLEPRRRFDLQEALASELGRDVDLVDLHAVSTVMAVQVVGHGTLLYEGDAAVRGQFEDLALARYARFNEERRSILERVVREGTVYGR